LSEAVDSDTRVLGGSYSSESAFVTVEADSPKAAAALAEDIVRQALPAEAVVKASQVYDAEGNFIDVNFAKPS
jgi:hypothetical protein